MARKGHSEPQSLHTTSPALPAIFHSSGSCSILCSPDVLFKCVRAAVRQPSEYDSYIQRINGRASSFVPALCDICVISSFYFRSSNIMTAMAAVTLNMRMYLFMHFACGSLCQAQMWKELALQLRQGAVRLCIRFSAYGLMLNVTSSAFTPC